MDVPENRPAFPYETPDGGGESGMTLRDYFAGQALPSIIVAVSAGQHTLHPDRQAPDSFALDAYAIADAMLLARTKGGAA
jgi:hypothetical protein